MRGLWLFGQKSNLGQIGDCQWGVEGPGGGCLQRKSICLSCEISLSDNVRMHSCRLGLLVSMKPIHNYEKWSKGISSFTQSDTDFEKCILQPVLAASMLDVHFVCHRHC